MFNRSPEDEWTRFSKALSQREDTEPDLESQKATFNALGDKAEETLQKQQEQSDQDDFNQRMDAGIKLHGMPVNAETTHLIANRPSFIPWNGEKPTLSGGDPADKYIEVGGYPDNEGTKKAHKADLAEREGIVSGPQSADKLKEYRDDYRFLSPYDSGGSNPQAEPADLSDPINLDRPDLEMNPHTTPYDSIDNPTYDRKKDRYYAERSTHEFPEPPAPLAETPRPEAVVTNPTDPDILAQTGEVNNEPSVVSLDDETHEGRNNHRRSGGAGMIFSGARNALNNAATAVGQEFRRLTEVPGNSNLEQTPMPNNLPAPNPSDNPYGLDSNTDSLKPFPFTTEPPPVAAESVERQTHNLNPKPSFIDKIMVKANPLDDPVGEYFENELSKEPEAPTPAEPEINTTPTTNTLVNPDNSTITTSPPDPEPASQVEPQPVRRHIQLQPGVHGGHDADSDVILGSTATPEPNEDSGQARMTGDGREAKKTRSERWKNMSHWEKSLYKINKAKEKLNTKSSEVISQVEDGSKTVLGATMPDLVAGAFAGATTEQVLKRTKVIESGLLSMGLGLAGGAAAGAGSAASRELFQIYQSEYYGDLFADLRNTIEKAIMDKDNRKKLLKSIGSGAITGLIGAYAGQKLADIILEESKKRRGK